MYCTCSTVYICVVRQYRHTGVSHTLGCAYHTVNGIRSTSDAEHRARHSVRYASMPSFRATWQMGSPGSFLGWTRLDVLQGG